MTTTWRHAPAWDVQQSAMNQNRKIYQRFETIRAFEMPITETAA